MWRDCSLKALSHYDAIPPECDAFALPDEAATASTHQETAAADAAATAATCSVPSTTPDAPARGPVLKLVKHVARHRRLPRNGKRSKQSSGVEVAIAVSRQSSLVELSLRAGVVMMHSAPSGFSALCGQPWSGRVSESVLPSEDLFAPDGGGRQRSPGSCAVLAGGAAHTHPAVRSHSMVLLVDEAQWTPRFDGRNEGGRGGTEGSGSGNRGGSGSGSPRVVRVLGARQSAALLAGQTPRWLANEQQGASEAPRHPAAHLLLRLSSAEQLERFAALGAVLPQYKPFVSDTTALARYRAALLESAGRVGSHSTAGASGGGGKCPSGLGTTLLIGSLLCSRMHVFGLGAAGQATLCDGPAAQGDCHLLDTLSDAGLLCLEE